MSRHLTRELLLAIADGDVSVEDALRLALDHLSQVCPECHQAFLAAAESLGLEDLQGQRLLPGSTLLRVLERDRRQREEVARQLMAGIEAAGERAPEVVREDATQAYANPVLAEILLSRTWEACKRRKPQAKALALATFEVGKKLGETRQWFELGYEYRFAGLTLAANAERIADRFEKAFELLERAEELMVDVADPGLLCDFHRVMGRTCFDARLLEAADRAIECATHAAADASDTERMAKVKFLLADVQREKGNIEGCVATLKAASVGLDTCSARTQGELQFMIRISLTLALIELGNVGRAERELEQLDPNLFGEYGQEARWYWLRGLFERERKRYDEAIMCLRRASDLFHAQGYLVEVGLVLVDLARASRAAQDVQALSRAEMELAQLSELIDDPIALAQVKSSIGRHIEGMAS